MFAAHGAGAIGSGRRGPAAGRRQDRPNAILWLVRNHPELKDSQIMRLVGTTKSTIQAIRDRSHWNSANLSPLDPVAKMKTQKLVELEARKSNLAAAPPPRP